MHTTPNKLNLSQKTITTQTLTSPYLEKFS